MDREQLLLRIINEPEKLSDDQKRAVLSDKRYIRVIAGAGAGKTETLTRRIIYLLLYKNLEPKNIVAFTFTEKAALNMKNRIYERVKRLKGVEACARLGEMYVGTIHGYCLQILQDYFDYEEYSVLDENQEMAFVLREGWGLGYRNLGGMKTYSEYCTNLLKSINVVYDELISRKKIATKSPEFLKHFEKYEKLLKNHRLFNFGQIIFKFIESLEKKPKTLSYVRHLIVDEYQDINRAQEKLIRLIGKNCDVFVVGDPRQSIYQWRGSDESYFEGFIKNFPGAQTFQINENRRSTKEIVDIANRFADTFEDIKYGHIKPLRKDRGASINLTFETPEEEAQWVVSQIKKMVGGEKKCDYSDCAILLRSVKTSAEPFIENFKREGIPYIVGGKVGLFRREEAISVGMLFCWLSTKGFYIPNPYRKSEKITGNELLDQSVKLWNSITKLNILDSEKNKIKKWKEDVLKGKFKNLTDIYHNLLVILKFKKLEPNNKNHSVLMANLGRFSNLLSDYESSIRLGGQQPDWSNFFDGLCWFINTYASGAYEEQPSEDLRGVNAVQIMTVHQAKGLEWPIVFIPALTNKRFPSSKVGMQQDWYISRDLFPVERYESRDKQGNKLYNSERKLFYVALTRPKVFLCLSNFKKVKKNQNPRSMFYENIEKLLTNLNSKSSLPKVTIIKSSEEEEIQTFSPAEIINYRKCPYFYRLREIWNYQSGLVEPLGYGKSLHHCLNYATKLVQNGNSLEDAITEAINMKFHVPYAGGIVRENMKKKAKEVLLNFGEKHKDEFGKIQDTEVRLEFPFQKATISGRVDVILKDGNCLEVRDYKTSDEVTTPQDGALQIQLYSLGLKSIGKTIHQGSLAYLEDLKVESVDVSESSLDNAQNIAKKSIEGIKNADFDATPCKFCRNCDYTQICKYKK